MLPDDARWRAAHLHGKARGHFLFRRRAVLLTNQQFVPTFRFRDKVVAELRRAGGSGRAFAT
jgi:hypothetical protein